MFIVIFIVLSLTFKVPEGVIVYLVYLWRFVFRHRADTIGLLGSPFVLLGWLAHSCLPVTKSLSMNWYWIGLGRYTSVLLAVS